MPRPLDRPRLRPLRLTVLPALVAFLAGCVAPPPRDAHVPDFARRPYEPFNRTAAVAIALREWRLFGSPVVDAAPDERPPVDPEAKPERLPGLWQRVGEYWWLGLDANDPDGRWTGKHDGTGRVFPASEDGEYAWSAAFISYVMRIAGAGPRFPYAASHWIYIDAARAASLGRRPDVALRAEAADRVAPEPGDLICFGRGHDNSAMAGDIRLETLPDGPFAGHCAIVVDAAPGMLSVVGGNVADEVALTHVPVTAAGMLAAPGGPAIDPRYPWSIVLRVLYDH
ncbi:hypothetical protein GCM10011611_63680 [Aliidongia dinghuensis]|uniref:DUF2272 domain-containing protein n=1 Tax=Aliidongia dinghuensis TaxID=1867774 RepID=A0A8J2Z021_9PROT|nr:DUF2272 domain-containing protein [Aliidongia dinghuensis]GGF48548.1 hypothetical protein GCM10011611_63680 [Aliidongia dinghuensis]